MGKRETGRGRKKESFSINFLFNVSASVPLWHREDASLRHKFATVPVQLKEGEVFQDKYHLYEQGNETSVWGNI